ncbi:MAG: dTDP-4-amino-4,6-dideoxygalactose transaminase [Arenicella sp.]|nr:dTDP-4-amino-4,6-dideoxygalactose transaminase [Arenicella sp.]
MTIRFNSPFLTGNELDNIEQALVNGKLSGDGSFTRQCQALIENQTGCQKVLLTTSCTSALEMSALLIDVQPGDEVIMPSYTFVSTANAFVLRGAVPVFVDIRPDTQNIDENLIEDAITAKTKAIAVVHYAGVACAMDEIMSIAAKYNLRVIEDAAQGVMSSYKGKAVGGIGDLGAFSYHDTKNLISGEGGSLLVNNADFVDRAEIIWEKGTNRRQFFRGEVDKYTWQDIGSSYLPSEITAAFLLAQMQQAQEITAARMEIWERYNSELEELEAQGYLNRPVIPEYVEHNAHMFYIILKSQKSRQKLLELLKEKDIRAVFHYIPLHSSPAGKKFGRAVGNLPVTDRVSSCLVRLPIWAGMQDFQVERVIREVKTALAKVLLDRK